MAPQLMATNGLLTGTRLAEDQHTGIVSGNLTNEARDIANRGRAAGGHGHITNLDRSSLRRHAQRSAQHRGLERKCETPHTLGAYRSDQLICDHGRTVSHHWNVAELLAQGGAQLDPITVPDIADQQRGRIVWGLDHGAHQRTVIDLQRFETQFT
jgi:hypothetical protein